MKKLVLVLAGALVALSSAMAQETGPKAPTDQTVKPKTVQTKARNADWESPDSLGNMLKLSDEQKTKLRVSYDKMNKELKAIEGKKLAPVDSFGAQIAARETYRKELRPVLNDEQKKKYEAELSKRAGFELTKEEAARLQELSAAYRKEQQSIMNNPNLTKEQKQEMLNGKMLDMLQKFHDAVGGAKKDKLEIAVKQMKEKIEKDKEAKDKPKEGEKPKDGDKPKEGDKPKDDKGGGGI